MTVDFAIKKTPAFRLATIRWKGAYSEKRIRERFEEVGKWARAEGLRTGRWVFREPGERTWDVGIEVFGKARSSRRVKVRKIPPATVASVTFDPELVSPTLVYCGLSEWLRWQKKEKKVRSVVSTREVYPGNPWKDPKAWARTEVQFVVRK